MVHHVFRLFVYSNNLSEFVSGQITNRDGTTQIRGRGIGANIKIAEQLHAQYYNTANSDLIERLYSDEGWADEIYVSKNAWHRFIN